MGLEIVVASAFHYIMCELCGAFVSEVHGVRDPFDEQRFDFPAYNHTFIEQHITTLDTTRINRPTSPDNRGKVYLCGSCLSLVQYAVDILEYLELSEKLRKQVNDA